ncbi:LysE family transporter [Thermomonospora cellulosilytica]|uniref:Chemosensory pili system protein ChpE n=1 Tax=Thermomonospora cellulosilytica TaxID=1411118 RepID=A0A7W3N0L5_9ACTN|nr:LysE family transporter [Thermomonospora cellulosilytica]MBA9005337.1 chemosensory pili system protein ChpE [Thermomonospora cellulosilytica]
MVEIFVLALGAGLVFNAVPGAVFAESLRRGVHGGFRPAFAVQVGSLAGDAVWALLGLAGVGTLFTLPALRLPLAAGGCLLLAWLGVSGLRDALVRDREPVTSGSRTDRSAGHRSQQAAVTAGAGMSLGNPWNVVYWSGAAGGVGALLDGHLGLSGLGVFFAGFMVSSLAWCLICASLIALLRRALPPPAVRLLEAGCGLCLLAFAALSAVRLLSVPL